MRKNRTAMLTLAAAALVSAMLHAPVALAQADTPPQCFAVDYDFAGASWRPSDGAVDGIRAPINMVRDGLLCAGSQSLGNDFVSPWIGIEDHNSHGITQIGFDHSWGPDGNPRYCRFWATGIGMPHDYDCGADPNGTTVYFRVETYESADNTYYKVYDCGVSGFSNPCTIKNAGTRAYSNAYASAASETNHGCASYMQGSTSDKVTFGNSLWRLDGNDGSGWGARTWALINTRCTGDYSAAITSNGVSTWDTRNSS